MSGTRYGVLLVTGGRTHQEDYAAAFVADARCRLVAVTDEPDVAADRLQANEELAVRLGVPHVADIADALRLPEVQVVSICAPPERRGRIAIRCAEAGKHLYLDKSLVPRLDEADALVAAVRRFAVRSHMFSFITQPWARQARQSLTDGQIGKVLSIHADVFFAKGHSGTAQLGARRIEQAAPERQQLMEAKRELDNVGVYPITLASWLTGRKFRSVYAVTANYFFEEHQRNDVEDFGLISGLLEGDLPITIAVGRCGWCAHPTAGRNRMQLVGNSGTLVVDANRPRLEVFTDQPAWSPPAIHPADPMAFWTSTQKESGLRPKESWVPIRRPASDAAYFLDCLDQDRASEMSVVEAAHATEVLLAAYRSAANRRVVFLPLSRP
jgi:predicted dehydrogenase